MPSSEIGRQPRQGRSAYLETEDSKTSYRVEHPSSCYYFGLAEEEE